MQNYVIARTNDDNRTRQYYSLSAPSFYTTDIYQGTGYLDYDECAFDAQCLENGSLGWTYYVAKLDQ